MIDGSHLARILVDPKIGPALKRVYGRDGMTRLKRISNELYLIDRQYRAKGGVEITPDKPGWLLQLGGTLIGTRVGAKFAGARGSALKLASAGSNTMQVFMNHMMKGQMREALKDSLDDPKLYTALLKHNLKMPKRERLKLEMTLRAWMLGSGAHLFTEEELGSLRRDTRKEPSISLPTGTPPTL